MSHYAAINIGPIGLTLSLARKPREFWQASYLFSHLMKRLLDGFCQDTRLTLLSPQVKEESPTVSYKTKAGIYPDRAFFKSEQPINDNWVKGLVDIGLERFAKDLRFSANIEDTKNIVREYFNVMTASCESDSDREAIKQLNEWLNYLELSAHAPQPGAVDKIHELIQKEFNSPLFILAFGDRRFKVETLEDIAEYEWKKLGAPKRKTYHNYICIVQADGDNMGKIVTHLPDGKLAHVSNQLTSFGKTACTAIAEYGGMPIYAGGDDLLFIAPVWGGKERPQSIFDLIETLDTSYAETIGKTVKEIEEGGLRDEQNQPITTSMSFGLSITYAKYPLYEAWQYAASQLFDKAKQDWKQKHAIAWKLQKHSGSGFEGSFSCDDIGLYQAFKDLINTSASENMVSAVAHKLRSNQGLLALFQDKTAQEYEKRLDAFFTKIVDEEGKDDASLRYFEQVKTLLKELNKVLPEKTNASADNETMTGRMIKAAYGMLRTAKFFNGEEDKL